MLGCIASALLVGLVAPTKTPSVSAVSLTRGPYLQNASCTAVTLCWRTDVETTGQVWYGGIPGNLIRSQLEGKARRNHEVRLTGLAQGTTYYYAVGTESGIVLAGGDADHSFNTTPLTGASCPTRIWAIGDAGSGTQNQLNVRDAYVNWTGAIETDVWLMLGDNAYTAGTDLEYQSSLFDVYQTLLADTVVWSAFGNHDSQSADVGHETGPFFDIFCAPEAGEAGGLPSGREAYYSFDHGNVHFICLASPQVSLNPGTTQTQWLQADLAANTQRWTIAYLHHPPYSDGSHDSDVDAKMIEVRTGAIPILDAGGVDLVLTGHSHGYERSMLIDGHYGMSDTFSSQHVVDGGDGFPGGNGAYHKLRGANHGMVHIVAGSSGKVGNNTLQHPIMIAGLNSLGSLVLDVEGGRLDATFLNDIGDVLDEFTLIQADVMDYGQGKINSLGLEPKLGYTGEATEVTGLAVTVRDAIPNAPGLIFWGTQSNSVPFCGGTLLIGGKLTRLNAFFLDGNGAGSQDVLVDAGMVGATRYFQFWYRDNAHVDGTGCGLSNGLQVTFE